MVALIRGISVITSIEISRKDFLFKEICWYKKKKKNPKLALPVVDLFWSDFKAANFELEAEKITSEIFEKTSFVVQRKKVAEIQPTEKLLHFESSKSRCYHIRNL